MTEHYDPLAVEAKWQRRWERESTSRPDLDAAARPYLNLMMFPYPSAEGLHIGNIYAFTGADAHGRFQRLRGYDVLQPIGFDAFGIHSENFALKQGTNPATLIPKNVANFRRQLARMGFMYDWSRTVDTTDPTYYKWTQWIFLRLFEAGLAQRRRAPVNWCPSCKTVLANEQVVDGACERCATAVVQRLLEQWFFRITAYAERLLADLDWIDWSDSTKRLQSNWIGRSEGAEIDFPVANAPDGVLRVFTTRPDTVFGATFLGIAPEHPLALELATAQQRDAVDAYIRSRRDMDVVARRRAGGEQLKTGVFTGSAAVNPANGEHLPVWIGDYVRMEYGHGAVMGVPAHDERDFEFARAHGLPVRLVVAEAGAVSGNDRLERAYTDIKPEDTLINSGRFTGLRASEAGRAVTAWLEERAAGVRKVNYRLHDWCVSRQRYWGPPIPVLYCDACGIVPVPDAELPVVLPQLDDFRPDESGVAPLGRTREFVHVCCPRCGGPAKRETDVSDTFLDSAWYFLRYPSTEFDTAPFEPARTRKWLPVDMYVGGEEHAVLHLMYARFITMVLKDLGYLDFEEPFRRFRRHGIIVREGAKMSKSRGNVVVPDTYIEQYGADTLRTYLMFMGPFQEGGDFHDAGITGIARFFRRLWGTIVPVQNLADGPPEKVAIEWKLHATVKKVTEDVENLHYNTAIAALMDYLNAIRAGGRTVRRSEVEPIVPMVAVFAPHLAEELWERLGATQSLFSVASWPSYDREKAMREEIEIAVQINGKRRASLRVPRGAGEPEVVAALLRDAAAVRHLGGKPMRKVIHVPDRIINVVV